MKKPSLFPFINSLAICALCLGIAAFYYWDLTRFPPQPLPPLIAVPAVIDFGDIQGQDVVQGTSSIKNTTKKPVRLLHAVVSCSCSDVKLRQGELLPGETTELSVTWDLRGRTGTTAASLSIVYVLEDDLQQMLTINLRAKIIPSSQTESGILQTD